MIVPQQLVTNAILTALRAQPGWTVHDHPHVIQSPSYPYLALFAVPGGGFTGPPLTNPHADVQLVYQLDAVGARRDQAQLQGDKAARVMVGRAPGGAFLVDFEDVEGWAYCDRMPTDTTPGGVEVVPATPTLYRDTRRYTIALTPQG